MLSQNIGMDRVRRDTQMLTQKRTEPGRIEDRTGPNDAAGRDSGKFGHHPGEQIDGIGSNQEHRIRRILNNLRGDDLEDLDIPFKKLQACLHSGR